jgi:hypothetical protein
LGADADEVLPFLDKEPDLLTGSQVRNVRAIDVETHSARLSLQVTTIHPD